jgi:hypothetical protein
MNFYLYEVARTYRIERKGWHQSRFVRSRQLGYVTRNDKHYNTARNFLNHEGLETVQFSYVFVDTSSK